MTPTKPPHCGARDRTMGKGSLPSKAIGLGGIALSAAMFMATASTVTQRQAPELAVALFPINADARARVAEADFTRGANARIENLGSGTPELERAAAMARRSLESLPLNPRALRILALADPESAITLPLLEASHRQSRRDTLTQAYLIEFAAKRGEIGQAMEHYDAVLRRRSAYRDSAGRNLAVALTLPGVLEEVAEQLPEGPSWESLLYFYALRTPESHDSFLDLHRVIGAGDTIPSDISAQFAAALINAGRFDDAVEIAGIAAPTPLVRVNELRESEFETASPSTTDLDATWPGQWIIPDEAEAFLQPIQGGGALITLPSGADGVVAYRLIALEQGQYRASLSIDPAPSGAAPISVRLVCATDAGVPTDSGDASIIVGDDCQYQWLILTLPQSQTRAEDVFVDAISIRPTR
ncbi:MAG: hypothetical protein ABJN35_12830 [Erythrobacter sp.]